MSDEITLEHDVDAVLGLVRAEGAEAGSLLDEPTWDAAHEPEDDEGSEGDGDGSED